MLINPPSIPADPGLAGIAVLLMALLLPLENTQALERITKPLQGIIVSKFNQKTAIYYPGMGLANPGD